MRFIILMLAMRAQAVALSMERSKSLARRRQRPSQANVRSTTQRRGRTSKPLSASERLMISMVQLPWRFIASRRMLNCIGSLLQEGLQYSARSSRVFM